MSDRALAVLSSIIFSGSTIAAGFLAAGGHTWASGIFGFIGGFTAMLTLTTIIFGQDF